MSLLGLKLKLGLFPDAKKIDKRYDALVKEHQDYVEYSQSEELERFEYLNKYLNSAEFEEKENNPDSDREEIKSLKKELEVLKKSPKLIQYFKSKAQEAKFIPIKAWNVIFEDHFIEKLNADKWLTRYYWGDKLLNDNYSLPGDQHYNTGGKNISVSNSVLSIVTQNEKAKGAMWHPELGFVSREFSYTSGVINTGKSFRHQFGKVEAMVKIPKGHAYHAFWLSGERMLPQINIFEYTGGKFYLGNFWGDAADRNGISQDNTAVSGAFAGRYCIFSLEWTPKQLTWSVNGVVFKTIQRGIPTEPMYLSFASGVKAGSKGFSQSLKLEIDWVRFYTKA